MEITTYMTRVVFWIWGLMLSVWYLFKWNATIKIEDGGPAENHLLDNEADSEICNAERNKLDKDKQIEDPSEETDDSEILNREQIKLVEDKQIKLEEDKRIEDPGFAQNQSLEIEVDSEILNREQIKLEEDNQIEDGVTPQPQLLESQVTAVEPKIRFRPWKVADPPSFKTTEDKKIIKEPPIAESPVKNAGDGLASPSHEIVKEFEKTVPALSLPHRKKTFPQPVVPAKQGIVEKSMDRHTPSQVKPRPLVKSEVMDTRSGGERLDRYSAYRKFHPHLFQKSQNENAPSASKSLAQSEKKIKQLGNSASLVSVLVPLRLNKTGKREQKMVDLPIVTVDKFHRFKPVRCLDSYCPLYFENTTKLLEHYDEYHNAPQTDCLISRTIIPFDHLQANKYRRKNGWDLQQQRKYTKLMRIIKLWDAYVGLVMDVDWEKVGFRCQYLIDDPIVTAEKESMTCLINVEMVLEQRVLNPVKGMVPPLPEKKWTWQGEPLSVRKKAFDYPLNGIQVGKRFLKKNFLYGEENEIEYFSVLLKLSNLWSGRVGYPDPGNQNDQMFDWRSRMDKFWH